MSVPEAEISGDEAVDAPAGGTGIAAHAAPETTLTRLEVILHVATFVLLIAAPFLLGPANLNTLGRILFYALLAASLALLIGFVGLPSLAQAAYFGIGAYAAGLTAIHVSASVWLMLLFAVGAAAIAAAVTGWLVVRMRGGIFFLMLTLALGEMVFLFAERSEDLTGGSNGLFGIPAAELTPGSPMTSDASVYWFLLAVFAVGYAALWAVARSPFGLALRGIRDNEDRMRALGYRTFDWKYAAFIISGSVAGLAGSLIAVQSRLVTPADASFGTAVVALVAVIIGGAGSLWGACVGAGIVLVVRDEIGSQLGGHGPLLLGAIFILAVYVLPGGVAELIGKISSRGRR